MLIFDAAQGGEACGSQPYVHQWNSAKLSIEYQAMDMNDAIIGVGGRTTSVAGIIGNSDPWEA